MQKVGSPTAKSVGGFVNRLTKPSGVVKVAKRENWKRWVATLMVLLGLWTVVLVLFRGREDYGMNYDEVLRLAPYLRLVHPEAAKVDQAIYSLKLGTVSIPIMLKSYISSLGPLSLVPALFFERQPAGLRLIEMLYFLICVSILFLFLRGYDFALAAWTSLLVATAPHLYPEVRFGFVTLLHVVFLVAAAVLARKGMKRPTETLPWFGAGVAVGLCVNVLFYSLWTLAGLASALCVVFPQETWNVIRRVSRVGAFAAGVAVGAVNFVIFNLATAGGSLRPLWVGLFDRTEYNRDPIDYRVLPQFSVEISNKLRELAQIVGEGQTIAAAAFAAIVGLMIVTFVVGAVVLRRRGPWELRHRACFFSPVAFTVSFLAILVTPKSGRAGHWAFVSPLLELAIVSVALLVARELLPSLSVAQRRGILAGGLTIVAGLFFAMSNFAVVQANATKGEFSFSPAIYAINDELSKRAPGNFEAIAVDWGFWSQLYFLSNGRLPVTELSFRLANQKYAAARDVLGTELARLYEPDKQILFLFHGWDVLPGAGKNFRRFVAEMGGKLDVRTFAGKVPGDRHFVARLQNPEEVLHRWRGGEQWSAEPLVVLDYGPRSATVGQGFNVQPNGKSSMWFKIQGGGEPMVVMFGGERLPGFWDARKGLVTVAIPRDQVAKGGQREIRLCDLLRDICSASIHFPVLPPT
jgi:hypothetical protein